MNPGDEMDLTRYLQTEGRRLAAVRRQRAASGLAPRARQQQCGEFEQEAPPPHSLAEALYRMEMEKRDRRG